MCGGFLVVLLRLVLGVARHGREGETGHPEADAGGGGRSIGARGREGGREGAREGKVSGLEVRVFSHRY